MFVKDRLKANPRELITCTRATTIIEIMDSMLANNIRSIPVLGDAGELVGIVCDKDIFRAIFDNQDSYKGITAKDIMTEDLIIGVPDDDINYIAGLMTKNEIRHVPIMEKDKLIGMISAGDIVKAQMKHIEIENRYLKMYIDGTHMG